MSGAALPTTDAMMAAPAPAPAVAGAPATSETPAINPRPVGVGYADLVAKVTPAVVTIRTERKASPQFTQLPDGFPFGELFGQRAPRWPQHAGADAARARFGCHRHG